MKKRLIIPNDHERSKALSEIGNPKFFLVEEQKINEKGMMLSMRTNKKQNIIIESNTKDELDKVLKLLTPTAQKSFIYLVNYAIQNGYIDKFSIDINEFLSVLGQTRKTDSVRRIYKGLQVFTAIRLQCQTILYDKGANGERKKIRESLESTGTMLSFVRVERKGRKIASVKVQLGDWFTHFRKARQNDDAYLLALPLDCLKVDTKRHPYAFGVPYRFAQHARTNAKRQKDWHVLTLKEAIEGVEPWGEAEKKMRMYGFNHERSLIERLTRSLEHAEKPFGLTWEWVGSEPRTLSEAKQAKIRFKFSNPLKHTEELA